MGRRIALAGLPAIGAAAGCTKAEEMKPERAPAATPAAPGVDVAATLVGAWGTGAGCDRERMVFTADGKHQAIEKQGDTWSARFNGVNDSKPEHGMLVIATGADMGGFGYAVDASTAPSSPSPRSPMMWPPRTPAPERPERHPRSR